MKLLDVYDRAVRVSIDPGKRHAGIGIFYGRSLIGGKLVGELREKKSSPSWPQCVRVMALEAQSFVEQTIAKIPGSHPLGLPWWPVDEMVFEYPQIVKTRHASRAFASADPNDLKDLAFTQGAMLVVLKPRAFMDVDPARWKGTIDPEIVTNKIKSIVELDDSEKNVMYNTDHNTYDGVGLGLWRIGRLHPERF